MKINLTKKYSKVIIFDLDGTLVDSGYLVAQSIKHQYPDITDKMQKELLVGNFHEEISKITLSKRVETDEEKNIRRREYSLQKSRLKLFDGIQELLQSLYSDGYILVINTSAYNRNCVPLLEELKIINLFDFLATAEISKNKEEKFKLIEARYNISTEDMLFVTDTLGDIREADKANIPTVAVTWGAHDESYFLREKHHNLISIISSVKELESFLKMYS